VETVSQGPILENRLLEDEIGDSTGIVQAGEPLWEILFVMFLDNGICGVCYVLLF
jgi:hypothetical protein